VAVVSSAALVSPQRTTMCFDLCPPRQEDRPGPHISVGKIVGKFLPAKIWSHAHTGAHPQHPACLLVLLLSQYGLSAK
jgi:hypothetical protein